MGKGTKKVKTKSLPGIVAFGTCVSLTVTLITAAATAILIESSRLSPETMRYAVMIVLMVSSLAGAVAANKQAAAKKMVISMATAMCYFAALLCVTALFFDGMYRGIPATALVVFTGSIIAGLIPAGQGRTNKIHKRKKRYG